MDGIIYSVDLGLGELRELVVDREAWSGPPGISEPSEIPTVLASIFITLQSYTSLISIYVSMVLLLLLLSHVSCV